MFVAHVYGEGAWAEAAEDESAEFALHKLNDMHSAAAARQISAQASGEGTGTGGES